MHYVLAGASGFLGRALQVRLSDDGHDVTRLVRGDAHSAHESAWDPAAGGVDAQVLARADVVVNLAGANIGRLPWTESYRRTIRESRVTTTRTLADALAALPNPPVFVAQSGVDFYGRDRGDDELDEDAASGDGFLTGVVRDWEQAAEPAEQAGVRVLRLRTAPVLDRSGGVLPLISLPFKVGLGGRLGSGRQYMPMMSLPDWVAAVRFLAERDECRGAYNLTMPEPATNAEFTRVLGAALHRPTVVPVPSLALRTLLGDFSEQLLGSARVYPRRLLEAGFTFDAPDLAAVVSTALHER